MLRGQVKWAGNDGAPRWQPDDTEAAMHVEHGGGMGSTRMSNVVEHDTKRDEPGPELRPWCEVGVIFKEDGDVVIERRYGDIDDVEAAI
jgi:hypothetical protein